MNVSEYRPANSRPAATPYSRHDPLPAAQSETSHHDTSRDLNSPYRPATFTNLPPPQNSTGRSGIESFLRRPNQEEEDRNNALNQSILDVGSQAIDSDGEPDNMAPSRHSRSRRAADEFQVDLTQSPVNSATQQSRTRKRSSISDEGASGSAKKRVKGPPVVVDEDDVFEDEAPSAEAELLQAQQADALKMQETNKEDAAAVKIGKRNCIICLESYTNATTAICGKHRHVYSGVWSRIAILTPSRPHLLPRMSDARTHGFGEEQRPWQGKLPGVQKSHQSEKRQGGDPDQLYEEERIQDQGSTGAQQMTASTCC